MPAHPLFLNLCLQPDLVGVTGDYCRQPLTPVSLRGNLISALGLLLTPVTHSARRMQVILLMELIRDTSRAEQLGRCCW